MTQNSSHQTAGLQKKGDGYYFKRTQLHWCVLWRIVGGVPNDIELSKRHLHVH